MFKSQFPTFRRMSKDEENKLKQKIFDVIFEANTPYGKLFDITLLFLIMVSVGLVMLESVPAINARYHSTLVTLEWTLTSLFTIEYLLRVYCVKNRWRYIFSFYGIIDLLSILPFYLGLFFPSSKYLSSIRILRLLRIFRIFNLTQFTHRRNVLVIGLKESKDKIIVFLSYVILIVVVIGSIMFMVEHDHPESGFTSIPISIYWAIVTLTTVGYGDISPVTGLGQFLASLVMIIGYGIIAVPTGIVTAEFARKSIKDNTVNTSRTCKKCNSQLHFDNAKYCHECGTELPNI